MADSTKVVIIHGERVELHEDEIISDATLAELTDGRGADEE